MLITAAMEPLIPGRPALRSRASEVLVASRAMAGENHAKTIEAVEGLLRTVNCYYSNLIEGHDTHPIDIDRAMHAELSADPVARDLQIEARAHVEVERMIEDRLRTEPAANPCAPDFLR